MKTYHYVIAVDEDDDGNVLDIAYGEETSLPDPSEPVWDDVEEEWESVDDDDLDKRVSDALVAALGTINKAAI